MWASEVFCFFCWLYLIVIWWSLSISEPFFSCLCIIVILLFVLPQSPSPGLGPFSPENVKNILFNWECPILIIITKKKNYVKIPLWKIPIPHPQSLNLHPLWATTPPLTFTIFFIGKANAKPPSVYLKSLHATLFCVVVFYGPSGPLIT